VILEEYRKRSMVIGKEIEIIKNGENEKAVALEIADDYSLIVKKEGGETAQLSSGEISIKMKEQN
jgi:BirA family biotin operon repressor/biotin-[acetyl-CoA-carboxylase] ligase